LLAITESGLQLFTRDELRELWQSAALVVDPLEPLIKEMAPEMDTEEREDRLFGDEGMRGDGSWFNPLTNNVQADSATVSLIWRIVQR
jgi:hypothetical protein